MNLDPYSYIENVTSKNPNKLIIIQLNISSLRNKFDSLVKILYRIVDILLISETKINSSFTIDQFKIGSCNIYRLDKNLNGGCILIYVRENIPSTLLNTELFIEGFYIEMKIRKKKWLLVFPYSPSEDLISNHRKGISILLCDLNSEPTKSEVRDFCQIYGCKNLNKDNTCFKNLEKLSCIDLIITNRWKWFRKFMTLETWLSDFHKMTSTLMKVFYKNNSQPLSHTAAINIFLMRCLWLTFRIGYLK